MERQQYGFKFGFWNVNGLSEEQASDDLLQNEIRKYDILLQVKHDNTKENSDNLLHPLRYFHDFIYKKNFNKKGGPSEVYFFINVVRCKEEFQLKVG